MSWPQTIWIGASLTSRTFRVTIRVCHCPNKLELFDDQYCELKKNALAFWVHSQKIKLSPARLIFSCWFDKPVRKRKTTDFWFGCPQPLQSFDYKASSKSSKVWITLRSQSYKKICPCMKSVFLSHHDNEGYVIPTCQFST